MTQFTVYKKGTAASVIVEEAAVHGMDYMAEIFCKDIWRVTDYCPQIQTKITPEDENIILVATCGHSEYLDRMEALSEIDLSDVRGKREVYGIFLLQSKSMQGKKVLVIAGSDKRGTIYGMFHLSQQMGVSPWVFWADANPARKEELVFGEEIQMISKEPSVKYRGFFINDEQPCLGNWAKEKYGSCRPCPEMYHHIFELLLRLKGNYLWPAMWRSDFTLDHLENAKLADKMGVIMGASHHEPCCRSGGEFQKLRKEHPEYGTEWSFLSNAEGVSRFWKDGLLRNRPFENLITIGMRGESDSFLMPEDATLEDNINVLKAAIVEQKKLIAEYGSTEHPQLLAIYKEVEDYYQGDETTPGLKEWDVLKDDIMMLCDDNFGNLRTMPNEEERKHPGGYGMYYHFDYFGGPTSYLWINSSPLTKTWEQMSMAYDFGVREAWIVNVGDIKNQELALSYFLDLAYDFDKWGTDAINQTGRYTEEWLRQLGFTDEKFADLAEALEEYVRWNGTCRPEVLRFDTYHPAHFTEAETMLQRVKKITEQVELLWQEIEGKSPLADCFFEVIYYPVMASANIICMQIYAGFNQHYVKQRKKLGNTYIAKVEQCILRDRELTEAYHTRLDGKWNHMQSVFHIGYTNWNDEEWQYPDCHIYHPVDAPRLRVNVADEDKATGGKSWSRSKLSMGLSVPAKATGDFEVANSGEGILQYRISWDADWLSVKPGKQVQVLQIGEKELQAKTEDVASFTVCVKPEKIADGDVLTGSIYIYGDNCEETADSSENQFSITRVEMEVSAEKLSLAEVSDGTFIEQDGYVVVEAPHYAKSTEAQNAGWQVIEKFGKTLGGVKVFPVTAQFTKEEDAPTLTYAIYVKEAGDYTLELYTAPSNPVVYKGKMCVAVSVNDKEYQVFNTIPDEGYVPWQSDDWGAGVLEQIHKSSKEIALNQGENSVVIKAMDPVVVLEKLVIVKKEMTYPKSYLGPTESFRK